MIKIFGFLAVALLACSSVRAQSEMPLLMQGPTLNASHIVFAYAGELWRVSREGGAALHLDHIDRAQPGLGDQARGGRRLPASSLHLWRS